MQSSIDAPGPRYEPLLQLLRTAETLWNSSRVFFERWGLSPSQFNVLNLLHIHAEGLTQSDLSRALTTHRSNVTGLVDRLEARGLVQRRTRAGDRRAWRVVLTDSGQSQLRKILPHFYQAAEEVWGGISVPRARQWAADLDRLGGRARQLAERVAGEGEA